MSLFTTGFIGNVGLVADITGAFFLAMSFVLKKPAEVTRESQDFMNGNPYRLPSAVKQKLEARTGFVFLFIGFMGQFVAYTSWPAAGPDSHPVAVLSVGAAVLLLMIVLIKCVGKQLGRRNLAKVWGLAICESFDKTGPESLEKVSQFYGAAFDVQRKNGESVDEFTTRLRNLITKWSKGIEQ